MPVSGSEWQAVHVVHASTHRHRIAAGVLALAGRLTEKLNVLDGHFQAGPTLNISAFLLI